MEEFIFAHWFVLLSSVMFIIALLSSFFTVEQQEVAIIERLGKFRRTQSAGLGWRIPGIDRIAGHESLRVDQLMVNGQMKTKDNVFIEVEVAVQFFVSDVFNAFYKLEDHAPQIKAYVLDVLRSKVPIETLDEVFASKDHLSTEIKLELTEKMGNYGFTIVDAVVVNIDPDEKVKEAMNSINAAQREQEAAKAKGEAEKILVVKQAEAEAESKRLQGVGIANERKAIIAGLKESVADFEEGVKGVSTEEVMKLVLVTQFFDTIKEVSHGESNTIMLPYVPSALNDIASQMREAILSVPSPSVSK